MNDADQQRCDQIRATLRRINGHKEPSPRQLESTKALIQELALIEGCNVDEIFK